MTITCTTKISNPGIAERLEKDTPYFEGYGFEFQRHADGTGILTSTTIPTTTAPLLKLQILVSRVALVASIGPYLRTLVRLCVDPIDPRLLQAVVVVEECRSLDDNARSLAHAIHMLIRNSMGAALFLDLRVAVPTSKVQAVLDRMQQNDHGCYEYPTVQLLQADECFVDKSVSRIGEPFPIDLGLVQQGMNSPPSIQSPIAPDCLDGFDANIHFVDLKVSTRMCSVRLTPLLYHLSQRLLGKKGLSKAPPISQQNLQAQHQPVIVVCLEKIANLYRVIMLVRDYRELTTFQRQLVVVCKSDSVQRFQAEAQNFCAKNYALPSNESKVLFPRVLSIEQARQVVATTATAPQENHHKPAVVGFDLHKTAKVLSEDCQQAKAVLGSAGAILLGYESDGIPPPLDQLVSEYVQIQSRTSVNVVAAFSIVLHVIVPAAAAQ